METGKHFQRESVCVCVHVSVRAKLLQYSEEKAGDPKRYLEILDSIGEEKKQSQGWQVNGESE